MDMKKIFLHGDLYEEIYMEQPDGFRKKGKEDCDFKLVKRLNGLKQAPRQWYQKFNLVMNEHGTRWPRSIIVCFYGISPKVISFFSCFMWMIGEARKILGIYIVRDRNEKKLYLSQEMYVEKVLRRFSMDKAKVVSTPLASHF